MSQPKISKEDVAKAMAVLKQDGQRVSLPAIRAAIGHKGSLNTIAEFKKTLDEEAQAAMDPPQPLAAFRAIWAEAVQIGRAQRDEEIADLQEVVRTLSSEPREFEEQATASRLATAAVTQKYEDSMAQVAKANGAVIAARADAERNATKLVEVIEGAHREADQLRNQMAAHQSRVHELELKLARAVPSGESPIRIAQRKAGVTSEPTIEPKA